MTRHALAALAIAVALPARAGVVLQYEDDDHKVTTVEMEGKKLRTHSDEGRRHGSWTLFDGDKQVLYSVDDEKKAYHRMDQASGTAMAKQMNDAMEKAKARMTPEQRAQLEAMMEGRQSGAPNAAPKEHTFKFERTKGGQKVAGYSCDNYRVLRDGKPQSEVCFVPWGTGALRKEDFVAFQEMGRFLEKTFSSMAERSGAGARPHRSSEWATHFLGTAPGFPAVMDRLEEGGRRTREMRLVKVERTSLPPDRFAPPADYREQKGPGFGGD